MSFKSTTQPLCRYCGQPIKKATHTVWFGQSRPGMDVYSTSRIERPKSKDEAQRLLNQPIVSMSWSKSWKVVDGRHVAENDHIHKVTTWDGESYIDEFFCKGEHARDFGYASARGGQVMPAWHDAVARQRSAR